VIISLPSILQQGDRRHRKARMTGRTKLLTRITMVPVFVLAVAAPAVAKPLRVTMKAVSPDGVGKSLGTITLADGKGGTVTITPNLKGLPPGEHGFHLHEMPSCAPGEKDGKKVAALAAGRHFDPDATDSHKGPGGGGHDGDLPRLVVSLKGEAKQPLQVKGLKLSDFQGKALVIDAGGDNYSDTPDPQGGGGDRIACGFAK
jgi:Cu-Zn family superoxide dismutase